MGESTKRRIWAARKQQRRFNIRIRSGGRLFKFMKKWQQFFEDGQGIKSMSRLLCFLSFFPASFVVVVTKNENMLGWYLGAYVLNYVGGKTTDIFINKKGGQNAISNNSQNGSDLDKS
jgi:hypothetical protein